MNTRQIISINHMRVLLPANANLNLLLKILSDSKQVRLRYHDSEEIFTVEDPLRIELQCVAKDKLIDPNGLKRLLEKTEG